MLSLTTLLTTGRRLSVEDSRQRLVTALPRRRTPRQAGQRPVLRHLQWITSDLGDVCLIPDDMFGDCLGEPAVVLAWSIRYLQSGRLVCEEKRRQVRDDVFAGAQGEPVMGFAFARASVALENGLRD